MPSPQPASHALPRNMDWVDGPIEDCSITSVQRYDDHRGWLCEVFRDDDLEPDAQPVMGYVSLTRPGVSRGPHEHAYQTDLFGIFSGAVKLFLWDVRPDSPTYGNRHIGLYGDDDPVTVSVPPGVVHAYLNVGTSDALIVNCPNRLYGGWKRREPVDEIRHEDVPGSPFALDDD